MESFQGPRHIYQPLQGNEIRVVKVRPFFPGDDMNRIEARLYHVPLDSSADFFALSYVWGDASQTQTISLDGHDFPVTNNLWWALFYIRARYDRNRKPHDSNLCPFTVEWDNKHGDDDWVSFAPCWWIDAICINQSDKLERSKQVPRMRDVYGMATRVAVWLGLDNFPRYKHAGQMVEAADANYTAVMLAKKPGEELSMDERARILQDLELSISLGELIDPLILTFSTNEGWYFGRIWTLQEVLVAREDPAVMIGQHTTTLARLNLLRGSLDVVVRQGGYSKFLVRGSLSGLGAAQLRDGTPPWRGVPKSSGKVEIDELRQFGLELYNLFATHSGRAATNPHDRIYGLLGLTSMPALPNHLTPDYGRPFQEVCYHYSKHLVQSTGFLDIFSFGVNRHDVGPSWVPTFALGSGGLQSTTTNSVTYSEDGRCMTVRGVQLGTAIAVHYEPALRSMDPMEAPPEGLVLSAWGDLVLAILQPAADLQSRTLHSVVEEWASHAFVRVLGGETDKLLHSLGEILDHCGGGKNLDTVVWSQDTRSCAQALDLLFQLGSHLLLGDGTVCHWPHQKGRQQEKPMIGDIVCAFRGTLGRTLLRPLQGTDGFSVQGPCWTFPISNITQTEEWFGGQTEILFNLY
ncbi:hypothetical protein B0T19DRAFT_148031 [Cercophora scortea]|uniref:Heterokaryon incompatibility domain-containing protein n=1 Tax=Cercophora scortea TaxID=314031 RepID=A0AAE0J0A9_9PEZI|nr:hypothetical protein B0T19DRAFT_148031 [Cercophora scortea]